MAGEGKEAHSALRVAEQRISEWPGAILAALLFIFLFTTGVHSAAADEGRSQGGGLFALSLEEVLEIRVDISEHLTEDSNGAFLLSRHEVLRLYSHARTIDEYLSQSALDRGHGAPSVPVLINGEYFGDFPSVAAATRHLRGMGRRVLHVELYVGNRATWFERGRAHVVLNVIAGSTPDEYIGDSRAPHTTEVLP